MKPCNESEIVGLKSMQPSKDYYKGYDAAEKNYMRILDKIRAEIEKIEINGHIRDVECYRAGINTALNIIDKYREEQGDADSN